MITNFRLLVILAFTLLSLSFTVNAQPEEGPGAAPNQQAFRRLGLSGEQLGRIREINRRQRPKIQRADAAVRRARRAVDDAIYSGEISDDRVREALVVLNRAQVELSNIRLQTEFEIRKVLTQDQLERFLEIRERRLRAPQRPFNRRGAGVNPR